MDRQIDAERQTDSTEINTESGWSCRLMAKSGLKYKFTIYWLGTVPTSLCVYHLCHQRARRFDKIHV